MSTIYELDKNECCGCSSCVQKCPKNAIKMIENEEGFLYPIIDEEKCINCGLCSKVCPQMKEIKKNNEEYPKVYAMYNKNDDELLKSSSGGIFSVIANYVIENGGVVFGAAYDNDFNVKHIMIDNKENLNLLRKSKYVQSNINNTYEEAERKLKQGKMVLFSGTPCQIAGLKSYLVKEYDNLITCDLVCHGVPSPKAFKIYIKAFEKNGKKVSSYDFRTKDKLEFEKLGKIEFSNGKNRYLKIGTDPFYNNFLSGNLFRESCYTCKYANMNRIGDITIGDFIGVHNVQPDAYNSKGISICIVNDIKSDELIKKIKNNVEIKKTAIDKIIKHNMNLKIPMKRPISRNKIYANLNNKLFIKDLKRNMDLKLKIKSIIPIKLKILLRNRRRK